MINHFIKICLGILLFSSVSTSSMAWRIWNKSSIEIAATCGGKTIAELKPGENTGPMDDKWCSDLNFYHADKQKRFAFISGPTTYGGGNYIVVRDQKKTQCINFYLSKNKESKRERTINGKCGS